MKNSNKALCLQPEDILTHISTPVLQQGLANTHTHTHTLPATSRVRVVIYDLKGVLLCHYTHTYISFSALLTHKNWNHAENSKPKTKLQTSKL